MAKGIVIIAKPSQFPSGAKTCLALPYLIRLVRSAAVDNGFSGIRSVLQLKGFQAALMEQENPQKPNEEKPISFEAPDFMPENLESQETDAKKAGEHFANLAEGEYVTVSEKNTAKYLVCNPDHKWLVVEHEGLLFLCACATKTVIAFSKKLEIIPVSFFSLI